jgi:hypothetical protein
MTDTENPTPPEVRTEVPSEGAQAEGDVATRTNPEPDIEAPSLPVGTVVEPRDVEVNPDDVVTLVQPVPVQRDDTPGAPGEPTLVWFNGMEPVGVGSTPPGPAASGVVYTYVAVHAPPLTAGEFEFFTPIESGGFAMHEVDADGTNHRADHPFPAGCVVTIAPEGGGTWLTTTVTTAGNEEEPGHWTYGTDAPVVSGSEPGFDTRVTVSTA